DAIGVHDVERVVAERQPLGVVMHELALESPQTKVLPREHKMSGRKIDIGDVGVVTGELREIGSETAADLEELSAPMPRELHDLRHPGGIFAISMRLDVEKPLQRVRPRLTRVLRSHGIVVPLVL